MNATVPAHALSRSAQRLLARLQPNNVMLGPLDPKDVVAMQELLDAGYIHKTSAFVLSDWAKER